MHRRLPLAVFSLLSLLASPMLAQGPPVPSPDGGETDEPYVYLDVTPSRLGNVRISASSGRSGMLDRLPQELQCNWRETERTKYSIAGVCRGWLRSRTSYSRLQLAPAVASLLDDGASKVSIYLDTTVSASKVPDGWKERENSRASYLSFNAKAGILPRDVPIAIDAHPNLVTPTAVVLLAPVVLAFFLRRNRSAQADRKLNQVVWMNWSTLAIWLYWISVVQPSELVDYLELAIPLPAAINITLGVLFNTLPPLISMAGCLIAMAPILSSSGESFKLLLLRQLAAQASFQIPLSIFLVGAGSSSVPMMLVSLIAAYLVFRGFQYLVFHISYSEITLLESGELFDRATALAQRAGVAISRFGMLRTKMPEEANAFAAPGNQIVVTESLVRGMTPREVDAVIAHELGHHQHGHANWNFSRLLFWIYFLIAGPALGWLMARLHVPQWVLTIPLVPLAFILLQSLISRRRELTADKRAAEITGDPEGTIAALGRLAQLSRVPVDGKGMMESILSHPSMERRVLALAASTGVAPERALEILRNPDCAYADPLLNLARAVNSSLPPAPPEQKPVFTMKARAIYVEKGNWWMLLAPLLTAAAIAFGYHQLLAESNRLVAFRMVVWVWLAAPPVILAIVIAGQVWLGKRFRNRIRKTLAERLRPSPQALFVGIHPGNGMRHTEGFWDWDFGFLTLDGDWLCYSGEKVRFAVSRHEVALVSVVQARIAWLRERRVEVLYDGGAFTLNTNFAFPTKGEAIQTQDWLNAWISDAPSSAAETARPAPPPLLPDLPGGATTRRGTLWYALKATLKIWLASMAFQFAGLYPIDETIIVLCAPCAIFLLLLPGMVWPIKPPAKSLATSPKLPEPAEPVLQ